jgi:hypothetical protein
MHGTYHKVPTLWKRETKKPHRLLVGHFARPEFDLLAEAEWEWTEKVDGTNIRIGWDGDKVRIGGKTDRAQIPAHLVERLNELFLGEANEQVFEQTFTSATPESPVTLYGEGYGAKIQKGGGDYKEDGADFVLFDVRVGRWWLERDNVEGIAEALGIDVVPVVAYGSLWDMQGVVREGFGSAWPRVAKPEGLVARAPLGLTTRSGERLICKLKYADLVNAVPAEEVQA